MVLKNLHNSNFSSSSASIQALSTDQIQQRQIHLQICHCALRETLSSLHWNHCTWGGLRDPFSEWIPSTIFKWRSKTTSTYFTSVALSPTKVVCKMGRWMLLSQNSLLTTSSLSPNGLWKGRICFTSL
ncbi:uncharacterized protein LOC141893855 [Acropora palmata]|uniref:uncharacterized protein LOC141893855 n=1 Tax=Acropora palmata TaxID=6131 RepID=UPI003DA1909E